MKALFIEGFEQVKLKQKLLALNWPFLLLITAIALAGVAALYSVAGGSLEPWASRHVVRYCLGLALLFTVALIDMRWWMHAAYPLYVVALLMLAAVLVFGVESGGATRWLGWGEFSFQPSEIMKIALVLAVAIIVGLQVSQFLDGAREGEVPWSVVVGSTIPLIDVLWKMSLLVATLSTVAIFLRLRTASLTEIQLRLAALEEMVAARGDMPDENDR